MRKSEDLCFMSYQQPAEDSCKQDQNILINQLHELSLSSLNAENMEDVWKKFVSTLHNAAESSFGKVKSTKHTVKSMNPTVIELSSRQKQLHIRLNSENDPEKRKRLASERNQILHHIRSILRKEGDEFWQSQAEAVDARIPDARSYTMQFVT